MDFASWLHVEAKTFEFSVADVLQLEESRRGLSCVVFMGKLCVEWLRFKVEALVRNTKVKKFIHSFRDGSKAFIVHRGANESGRFLEVAAYAVGGRRGLIMLSNGRGGQGWSGFAAELKKVLSFLSSSVGFESPTWSQG